MAQIQMQIRGSCMTGRPSSRQLAVKPVAQLSHCVGMKSAGQLQKLVKPTFKSFHEVAHKQIASAKGSRAPKRKTATMMPVSTPKVLVRPPGERNMEWVDLWEAYIMQKVVFINKPITEDLANNMIALTLYLDSLDKKRIYYWLNVPGGEVVPTLALYDTMQYVRSKTATVCYGMCFGMGGFLLTAGGEKGYRYAMPHSILMMHHPSGASRGQASDMQIESRELVRMRDYLTLVTSESTGQPYDRVIRELSRNKWMDPKQAIEYGMIDKRMRYSLVVHNFTMKPGTLECSKLISRVLTTPMPKMPEGPLVKFERAEDNPGLIV